MVLEHKKKHQNAHNSNVGVGGDKISNLPEALIHHILSFLPTKCGMSTCILSKRWKYISNSIPTLDFRDWLDSDITHEEEIILKTQQFMHFLDTVLYFHEKPNIQKFSLTVDCHFDKPRVNKWINMVIKRKVEQLFLSVGYMTSLVFPLSFFTCDSLTALDLNMIRLDVPNTVSFPRLKLLRLTGAVVVNGIAIQKLVSSCPFLEELTLEVYGFKHEVLCIENLALKSLHLMFDYIRESKVKICAPNLSIISYGVDVPAEFVFDSFPSLVEADINIYDGAETLVLIKLFEKLSNVLDDAEIPRIDLPTFNNLIHLEVSSRFDSNIFDPPESASTVEILFRFLQLSPNLESIVFSEGIYYTAAEDDFYYLSVDLECSLLHLKSIHFKDFDGKEMELNAIGFFLKYGVVLETITIVASPRLSGNYEAQTEAMRQLLMFPKPKHCVVKFLLSS